MKVVDAILAEKAREHNTTVADILGPSRFTEHVAARHDAIRTIAERHPTFSPPQIASLINKHHSTVYFALDRTRRKPKFVEREAMKRADRLRLYNLDMGKVRWPDELAEASRQARYAYGLSMQDVKVIFEAHELRCAGTTGSPAHCDEITAKQIKEAANVNHTAKPVRKNTGGVGDVPASLERRT